MGSKNRIAEAFLRDFQEAWQEHGRKAIERLAKKDPRAFVYAALALVPKEMISEEVQRVYGMLTPEEWQQKHAGGAPIKDIN